MTDAELIAATRAGNGGAFAELVSRYQVLACAIAYAASGSRQESEDLAQEALVVAWRRLGTLSDPDRFGPWLCGIVRNVAYSARRHARRHAPAASAPAERLDDLVSPAASPLEQAAARQSLALTWEALRRLPARYREPLVLYCRLEHSHARVARCLELSEEVVRQRIARARQKLRDQVDAVERGVVAAGPRRALAGAVVATVWARHGAARAGTAAGQAPVMVLGLGAVAAVVAIVLIVFGVRAIEVASLSTTSTSPATSTSRSTETWPVPSPSPSPSTSTSVSVVSVEGTVRMGRGGTRKARTGRVAHGPAVVERARPRLAPSIRFEELGALAP